MTKNERIAQLEKEVADLRYTISLLQCQIATLKTPTYIPYPYEPFPRPLIPWCTTTSGDGIPEVTYGPGPETTYFGQDEFKLS